jgi:hypothetical protein
VIAGILGGPITMLPAVIFCVAIIGQYGALVASGRDGVLPITILLNTLRGAEFLIYLFPIVLFGTFIETGAALVHGVNERLDQAFAERSVRMPRWMRPAVALAIFLLVYIVPVLTYGLWLLIRRSPQH